MFQEVNHGVNLFIFQLCYSSIGLYEVPLELGSSLLLYSKVSVVIWCCYLTSLCKKTIILISCILAVILGKKLHFKSEPHREIMAVFSIEYKYCVVYHLLFFYYALKNNAEVVCRGITMEEGAALVYCSVLLCFWSSVPWNVNFLTKQDFFLWILNCIVLYGSIWNFLLMVFALSHTDFKILLCSFCLLLLCKIVPMCTNRNLIYMCNLVIVP